MPVSTLCSVKTLQPAGFDHPGAQIILGNIYHLNVWPHGHSMDLLGYDQ